MNGSDNGLSWVDWTAHCIPDPVLRLRFLKATAPLWQDAPQAAPRRSFRMALAASLMLLILILLGAWGGRSARAMAQAPPVPRPVSIPAGPVPAVVVPGDKASGTAQIWAVEQSASFETYSNGLRIDNKFATGNHARSYRAFSVSGRNAANGEPRTEPAGIVFHTTESLQLPFEAGENATLQRVGEGLLNFVKRKRCYHFVVDRFGRVFRVVRETDAAEHAGYSVWSDDQRLYLNLNESFLGIAVETRTEPGQTDAALTAAQVRALAMLTEMLRSRYRIPAENCVTHAQVSVNPSRMLAGYHMDWASSFPFEAIGLPNNYARPVAAIATFGFQYDATYAHTAGSRLLGGANLAAHELAAKAAACGISEASYRKEQQRSYREHLAATRGATVSCEGE